MDSHFEVVGASVGSNVGSFVDGFCVGDGEGNTDGSKEGESEGLKANKQRHVELDHDINCTLCKIERIMS